MSAVSERPRAPDLTGVALEERYELRALIGEGTFGRVYRGYDRRLARAVAVKVIKPWWAEDPGWARRFEREVQLLASLSDATIVQIHDVGAAPEGLYYVSELVEGESLEGRLRRGPLTPGEAVKVGESIARALSCAHARGIVHRDIKPANVLLGAEGQVKLGDFGVARLAEGSTAGSALVAGTPRYMAPEQARSGAVSPASDVYSLGIVLHEMVSGRPPFRGSSAVELALAHLHDPLPPLPAPATGAVAAVVDRACEKDPAHRYPSGAELAVALRQAAPGRDGDPVPGVRPSGGGGTRIGSAYSRRKNVNPAELRQRRALFAGVALLVVLAVVLPLALATGRSAAPAVVVPRLVGATTTQAEARLAATRLRTVVATVPAPGARPGVIVGQRPAEGARVRRGNQVRLLAAETPAWRPVSALSGSASQRSAPVTIRGGRMRVSYAMSYRGTCTFIFICSGPSAQLTDARSGTTVAAFDLQDGSRHEQVLRLPAGSYRLSVTAGSDTARWRMALADWY